MVDTACAVIAPGQANATTTLTDINLFRCTYGHTYETLLMQTAKQQGVSLSGEFHASGVVNGKGATEAHRQADGHPSK